MNESKPKFTHGPWERVQKGIPLKKPTLLTLGKWEIKLAVYHNDLEICIITDTSNDYYNASLIAAEIVAELEDMAFSGCASVEDVQNLIQRAMFVARKARGEK